MRMVGRGRGAYQGVRLPAVHFRDVLKQKAGARPAFFVVC